MKGLLIVFLIAAAASMLPCPVSCAEFGGASVTREQAGGLAPEAVRFNQALAKAESGDAQAQAAVAAMFDQGKGVAQSDSEAARWWGKAAHQGIRSAQHNLGVAYASGSGVPRNITNAIFWLRKAAEQGDSVAQHYADNLSKGLSAATQVVVAPTPTAARSSQPAQTLTPGTVDGKPSEGEKMLAQIVRKYADEHTYLSGGIYECVDMASAVWNEVRTAGFKAVVRIGNVETDMKTIFDSNHAWVMAEETPGGKWLALECTGGEIIHERQNAKYYRGRDFTDPGKLKEFQSLQRRYNTAVEKCKSATEDYNSAVTQFNNSNWVVQQRLQAQVQATHAVLKERMSDLKEIETELATLLGK
jgi:Sel1 repeat